MILGKVLELRKRSSPHSTTLVLSLATKLGIILYTINISRELTVQLLVWLGPMSWIVTVSLQNTGTCDLKFSLIYHDSLAGRKLFQALRRRTVRRLRSSVK